MAAKPEVVRMTPDAKRRWMQKVGACVTGAFYRVMLEPCRPRRSNPQNRFYWGALVQPFAAWLVEQWQGDGLPASDAERLLFAHELLKRRHLQEAAGKVIGVGGVVERFSVPATTAKLDTLEFTQYLERCEKWLQEFCGIIIPSPEEWAMTGGGDDEYGPTPQF